MPDELGDVLLAGAYNSGERGLVRIHGHRAAKRGQGSLHLRIIQGKGRIEHSGWLQLLTTRVNTPVVRADINHWLYSSRQMTVEKDLDFNAAWLREMRHRLGWSTTDAANYAREQARNYGDPIKLSQQLVSKFENGRLKSNPRWLAYVQVAMSAFIAERGLPAGRLGDLRLSNELTEYFQERVAWRQDDRTGPGAGDNLGRDTEITHEDRDDVELLQSLSPAQREAVRQLMRTLASEAPSPPPASAPIPSTSKKLPSTLHSPGRPYSGENTEKGKAA